MTRVVKSALIGRSGRAEIGERGTKLSNRKGIGRSLSWLWAAYSVSALGTWLAFDAVALVAIFVLDAGPGEVSALKAVGLGVGAALALPIGHWVEFRRKRTAMMAADLVRFVVVGSVPAAHFFGVLTLTQLLVVVSVVAAADITFQAAAGAFLKGLATPRELMIVNARFESTTWTATMIGPPLGGAMIGSLGSAVTLLANAVSYLLSALCLFATTSDEPTPQRRMARRTRLADLTVGWRTIVGHPLLRLLLLNTVTVSGLILATGPILAVLMVGELGFSPLQYGLAFGVACAGGLLGSRLSRPLSRQFGVRRVLLVSGCLRTCWSIGLAFVGPGLYGLLVVVAVEFALTVSAGVFNPIFATMRLTELPADRVTRSLSAWSVTTKAISAVLTAACGVLAAATGARTTLVVAGVLLLLTAVALPWRSSDR